jgi:hypothetical protein
MVTVTIFGIGCTIGTKTPDNRTRLGESHPGPSKKSPPLGQAVIRLPLIRARGLVLGG